VRDPQSTTHNQSTGAPTSGVFNHGGEGYNVPLHDTELFASKTVYTRNWQNFWETRWITGHVFTRWQKLTYARRLTPNAMKQTAIITIPRTERSKMQANYMCNCTVQDSTDSSQQNRSYIHTLTLRNISGRTCNWC